MLNSGLLALRQGNLAEAQRLMAAGSGAASAQELLGNLYLAQGNYTQAAKNLKGVKTNSAALAQLLTKDYASARQTLADVARPDATTSYLKALVGARTGDESAALSNLADAISRDGSYRSYAARDLEFARYFNNAQFQNLVK